MFQFDERQRSPVKVFRIQNMERPPRPRGCLSVHPAAAAGQCMPWPNGRKSDSVSACGNTESERESEGGEGERAGVRWLPRNTGNALAK